MKKRENILFGYSCTPAYGFVGEEGGFSVEIDADGVLVFKTYLFERIEQTRRKLQLSPKTMEKLKRVLESNAEAIEGLNDHLYNGSCDGYCNAFVFSEKEIISWNIQFTDSLVLPRTSRACAERYEKNPRLENAKQEKTVLLIFKQMTRVLMREGIVLRLNKLMGISPRTLDFSHSE